ncbi:HCL030Wp [Eremothecium sinecaudum]|uniref:HCL030Wp n=1 Tax=Eremothecium sinecaudum TaxID=45286 RepID=A0A0X8HRJ3_9SACH|nr:HCL030Wp [Eremothecium sinecaudum]AMD20121.1 HCL030Wp [Eremothecium sinecaudum]
MRDPSAIQIINEAKEFNDATLDYFRECTNNRDVGLNYHVISVFGSQSSGKSTLLNALFNTNFDTMNAQVKRQQTTKGIWLAHTREVSTKQSHVEESEALDFFVLDVEGSDGAERGEDKDFERKAALFALATSEVLIVNMWEQQVGLYQGNNMGLLKTVFEVNLSLFGHKKDKQKIGLLFVIRDFTGFTPISSLSETLTAELDGMWSELNKPAEAEDSTIYDFFDLHFTGLSHKLFKPEEFENDVRKLGDQFIDKKNKNYTLKDIYHQGLPLDGWALYAANCWEQIESNKDLDLPTQQTLVARFKTEELAANAYDNAMSQFNTLSADLTGSQLAKALKQLKDSCLDEYDSFASRYMKIVYLEKRDALLEKLQSKFNKSTELCISDLIEKLVQNFQLQLSNKTNKDPFAEKIDAGRQEAIAKFEEETRDFVQLEVVHSLEEQHKSLHARIEQVVNQERRKEIKSIVLKAKKYLHHNLSDSVVHMLSHPDENVWSSVMQKFKELCSASFKKYEVLSNNTDQAVFDFQVGASHEENISIHETILSNAWTILRDLIHQYLKEDNVVSIIRDVFENHFRYDENDVPRLWKNEEEIDGSFKISREHAFKMLDILSTVSIDGLEVEPDVKIQAEEDEYEKEDGSYQQQKFAQILDAIQKQKVIQQFKRFANLSVIEAKRSTMTSITHIPTWLYAVIVVLGWNEFMMVIRNPFFISLLLLLGTIFYSVHKLNLWGPLVTFTNQAFEETRTTVKKKLRALLMDEGDNKPITYQTKMESFEMVGMDNEEAE